MYLCYVDESGTAEIPGTTSHYVLAGLSIPIWHWKSCEDEINAIKGRYGLGSEEIHVAWIIRSYREQAAIPGFERLTYSQRRYEVQKIRNGELLKLQNSKNRKLHAQTKKNFRKTEAYVHLTLAERKTLVEDVARMISGWGFARLFAECIDKIHFDPVRAPMKLDEQALEQVVSRFEHYLRFKETSQNTRPEEGTGTQKPFGLLIHDNNQTVAQRHTDLVKTFHRRGTFWTDLDHMIETPLFVGSELTSMVQIADLCAYSLRRYLENNEAWLFEHIFKRADRKGGVAVGVRHFTSASCACKICLAHRTPTP